MKTNGIFTLDWGSIADAIVMAVVLALVAALYGVVTTAGFDVFGADWVAIGKNMVNVGFIAAVVSLAQNFLSTNQGSVLGLTPPNQG